MDRSLSISQEHVFKNNSLPLSGQKKVLNESYFFRIVEIDSHQRIQLAHFESGEAVKVKVPHVTSDLHIPLTTSDPSCCINKTDMDAPSNQPAAKFSFNL